MEADPARLAERRELVDLLLDRIRWGKSPERTRRLVRMRFGIGYSRPYLWRECAAVEGISLERARQIVIHTLRRLRARASALGAQGDWPKVRGHRGWRSLPWVV